MVSSNIVGYNKVTLTSGYNMLGQNFKLVGGSIGDLSATMDASSLAAMDTDNMTFATELLTWNGVGYDTVGWTGDVGDPDYDNKWVDELSLEEVALVKSNGEGFWISSTEGGTVTFSGEVDSAASVTIDLAPGYNLVANPFPESIPLSRITSTTLPAMDTDNMTFSAELLTWNGLGYDTVGWTGNVGDPDYDNKWVDELSLEEPATILDIGKGCFIKTSVSSDVTFTK